MLNNRIGIFVSQPIESPDKLALRKRLNEIGLQTSATVAGI